MEVKQIYTLLNDCNGEILGKTDLLAEDLSNLVDNGSAVFDTNSFDRYSHTLIDKIGKMVFVNRAYQGTAPSVYMDSTTWGSVIQKVASELPQSTINEDWQLEAGTSYDPNVFNPATTYSKYYAKYVTFEVDRSITRKQMESAFSSASEMDGFISMIFNEIEKRFTIDLDNLIMRTINNAIAQTVKAEYESAAITSKSGIKAINLLYEYNQAHAGATLTAANCLQSTEFLKYATFRIGQTMDRMTRMSTLFNIGAKERFTPKSDQHLVLLSDFQRSADVYLQSTTWHNEYTALPNATTVPYWQATGTTYGFDKIAKIDVKTAAGDDVTVTGVLGCVFDRYALGVTNVDRHVNTNYNPKAEFTNYFYKYKAGYFNDTNENMVVFFVAAA